MVSVTSGDSVSRPRYCRRKFVGSDQRSSVLERRSPSGQPGSQGRPGQIRQLRERQKCPLSRTRTIRRHACSSAGSPHNSPASGRFQLPGESGSRSGQTGHSAHPRCWRRHRSDDGWPRTSACAQGHHRWRHRAAGYCAKGIGAALDERHAVAGPRQFECERDTGGTSADDRYIRFELGVGGKGRGIDSHRALVVSTSRVVRKTGLSAHAPPRAG